MTMVDLSKYYGTSENYSLSKRSFTLKSLNFHLAHLLHSLIFIKYNKRNNFLTKPLYLTKMTEVLSNMKMNLSDSLYLTNDIFNK